jgi:hypothetical protein
MPNRNYRLRSREGPRSSARKPRRGGAPAIGGPWLETLEDRMLLSSVVWSGAADGNWFTPGNWRGNSYPVSGDVVFDGTASSKTVNIDYAAGGDTVSISDGYTIGGATLYTNALTSVGNSTIIGPSNVGSSVDVVSGELTLAGQFDSGSLTKTGTGTLKLAPSPSVIDKTGIAYLTAGTLQVDGTLSGDALVKSGATLSGNGSVSVIFSDSGATLMPGDAGAAGTLSANSINAGNGTTVHITLDGTTAGIGTGHYSQISGNFVNLTGATLSLSLGNDYTPAAGDVLTIVNQNANIPFPGNLNGLTQGAVIHLGSAAFRISYTGGDGNDVTLTALSTTTATLTSNLASSVFGQSITLTAAISSGNGQGNSPTGLVSFYDNANFLGASSIVGGGASFSTTALLVGGHSITASYTGDNNFAGSTASAITKNVGAAATSASLASTSASEFGQHMTFDVTVAAVAPGSGTPTGNVMFYDATTPLGSGTLVNGIATLTTSTLTVGSHSITANYQGDSNFHGATSVATNATILNSIAAPDISATYTVGSTVALHPLADASDPAGDVLSLALLAPPSAGSAAIGSDGNGPVFTYTPSPGVFTPDSFTYQISNSTGNTLIRTATVTPTGIGYVVDPFNASKQDLVVLGDDNNNVVKIIARTRGHIQITINGTSQGLFQPTGRIIVMTGNGNDSVSTTGVALACWFYGGSGNVTLTGGSGDDVLIGGSGTSLLNGLTGHNLLIGGTGQATLKGRAGVNVLIAGSTIYDQPTVDSQSALNTILINWKSGGNVKARTHVVSASPGPRLDSGTVFASGSQDTIIGNSRSWVFGLGQSFTSIAGSTRSS